MKSSREKQEELRKASRNCSKNPTRVAEPEEKSDYSPLEQAFGAGVFAKVVGDDEEDDRGRKKETA